MGEKGLKMVLLVVIVCVLPKNGMDFCVGKFFGSVLGALG